MKKQFAWRHFYWYLVNEGIHISAVNSFCCLRLYLPLYVIADQRLVGFAPKVWRASSLQDSREGRPTEIPIDRVLCPLVPIKKLGRGQQLNSSLEADWVVDMVSYLSEVEGDYFMLDKLVEGRGELGLYSEVECPWVQLPLLPKKKKKASLKRSLFKNYHQNQNNGTHMPRKQNKTISFIYKCSFISFNSYLSAPSKPSKTYKGGSYQMGVNRKKSSGSLEGGSKECRP